MRGLKQPLLLARPNTDFVVTRGAPTMRGLKLTVWRGYLVDGHSY